MSLRLTTSRDIRISRAIVAQLAADGCWAGRLVSQACEPVDMDCANPW